MSDFTLPDHLKQELDFSRADNSPKKLEAEFKFDNFTTKPPIIAQAAEPAGNIKFNLKYLNTVLGILRVILIVRHFGAILKIV